MRKINLENVDQKGTKFIIIKIIILICLIISMIVVFIFHQKKIEESVINKNTKEIYKLSERIKRDLHLELEYSLHTLNGIEENINTKKIFSVENLRHIYHIRNKWHFISVGIMNLDGEIIDSWGTKWEVEPELVLKGLKESGKYVSDVVIAGNKQKDQILVAVPLKEEDKIVGALLGRYPISIIADKTELSETSQQYFQIIDTNGEYITKSRNKNVMAEKGPLWEELKKYKFETKITINELKENIKNKKSGTFYFTYKGNGRYVSYSPLDINNWYVFAVLTEKKLFENINEIRTFSNELLFYFVTVMICLIIIIVTTLYNTITIFKKQKQELEIKNNLFKMLMHKMNDIVFELDFKNGKILFFEHSNEEFCYDLKLLEPENMLKLKYIRKNSILKYKEIYEKLLAKEEIADYIIEVRKEFNWTWVRIHSIVIDSNYTIGLLEDYSEEMKKEFEISQMSKKIKYDYLTKLYTRETCELEIKRSILNYKISSGISALFAIDIDNFKKANDTFGHLMGDKILYETATSIKNAIRKTDISGRVGGDEFLVLLENVPTVESIKKIAEKLNNSIKKVYTKDGKSITISASIGIAIVEEGIKFKELYEKADSALYQVKTNGRDSYIVKEN